MVESSSRGERTILLVDLCLDVEVDARDDQVANNVQRAHAVEDIGVIEGNLLGDLHEPQDDDQVGAAAPLASCLEHARLPRYVHLRTDGHCEGWNCESRVDKKSARWREGEAE
jgi:hypothetical protein